MNPTEITLNWRGPRRWFPEQGASILDGELCQQVGIYVWTVPRGEVFLPYYLCRNRGCTAATHARGMCGLQCGM